MATIKMTRAEYQAKYGVAAPSSSATTTPSPVAPTPEAAPTGNVVKMTRAEYKAKYGLDAPIAPTPAPEAALSDGGVLKSLISAPATVLARPVQAAQVVGQAIQAAPNQQVQDTIKAQMDALQPQLEAAQNRGDRATASTLYKQIQDLNAKFLEANKANQQVWSQQPFSNEYVAPAPKDLGDLKKDVGRVAETVALGLGSPIAAGTLFGVGSSLEQGNDLFSIETAVNGLIGGAGGKFVGLVGKPLLDVTGKVVGTITPKILKDVASQGAGAVEKFMANHEIAGGALKPVAEKITSGAEAFDTGVGKLFTGTKNAVVGAAKSQYPTVGKDIANYYNKTEMDALMKPTTEAGATFNKAAEVAKQAEKRGIDLKKVATNNKIYPSEYVTDGKYNTADIAEALSNDAMSGGATVFRPALAEAEMSVERVPISEVRQQMINKVNKMSDTALSPEQKLDFIKKINTEYADNSVTAARYRDGYSLTNLYDSKLQTSSGLYRTPKGGGVQSISDTLTGQQKKIESDVFKDFLIERAPKDLNIEAYFKAQEEKFVLSNYLRTLDGKNAPRTLFQRGLKRATQLSGATVGAQTAGPFGMFSGYQFGGIMADTFANASNPVKVAFLKSIGKTEPEIYQIMREYVSDKEAQRLILKTPLLNAGNPLTANYPVIPLNPPKGSPSNTFLNNFNLSNQQLMNTPQLPAPEPRIITPNTQGTPNPVTAPYPSNKEVGGMRQRIFKGKK